jgi:hypothetical protein
MRNSVSVLLLALTACSAGGRSDIEAQRRQEFQKMMTGAILEGRFSSNSSDHLAADRYEISSVTHLSGELWTINTRIQYGSRDLTVPVPVRVLWAGDTPVLTLTDAGIPGLGQFTARVLIYRDQYAGTWSSSKGSGGQLFGRITRAR